MCVCCLYCPLVEETLTTCCLSLRWSMCSLARCLWTAEQEMVVSTRPPCEWRKGGRKKGGGGTTSRSGPLLHLELLPPAVLSPHHLSVSPFQPLEQLLFLRLPALLADPRLDLRLHLRPLHVLRDHAQLRLRHRRLRDLAAGFCGYRGRRRQRRGGADCRGGQLCHSGKLLLRRGRRWRRRCKQWGRRRTELLQSQLPCSARYCKS